MSPELVVLLIGAMVASSCGLIGSFLVLRRMALLGDAISHAVLPGIALAFLISGHRASLTMVVGAAIFGLLTVFLVELLNRTNRMKEDASIGVVFPALFAIGVILISRYAGAVDLDLDCVLYGEIAYAPWDVLELFGRTWGPEGLWTSGAVLLLDLAFVGVFFKELKLATFDAGLAASLGFSPVLLHYLLMGMVSLTVVGAFESVGAILVVAMLIVPPTSAYLLTDRLGVMLALSMAIGVVCSTLGYFFARWIDCSIAGAMASTSGLVFAICLFASPRHGLVSRWIGQRRMAHRLAEQLVMLHLGAPDGPAVRRSELAQRFAWHRGRIDRAINSLESGGMIAASVEGYTLTDAGNRRLESSGHSELVHSPQS